MSHAEGSNGNGNGHGNGNRDGKVVNASRAFPGSRKVYVTASLTGGSNT